MTTLCFHRPRWPRSLRHSSGADRLLVLWVRILPALCVSVASVFCFQVDASAAGWFLVQRSPTECESCVWPGRTATLYAHNDQAGRVHTKTKFILHFFSYTLSTNCCLIKRNGKWYQCQVSSRNLPITHCALLIGAVAKMRKDTIISLSCLSVCFLMEHLGSHWTNFHKFW